MCQLTSLPASSTTPTKIPRNLLYFPRLQVAIRLKSVFCVCNALDKKVVRIAYPARVQASCVIGRAASKKARRGSCWCASARVFFVRSRSFALRLGLKCLFKDSQQGYSQRGALLAVQIMSGWWIIYKFFISKVFVFTHVKLRSRTHTEVWNRNIDSAREKATRFSAPKLCGLTHQVKCVRRREKNALLFVWLLHLLIRKLNIKRCELAIQGLLRESEHSLLSELSSLLFPSGKVNT